MRLRSFCILVLVLVTFCMMQGCSDSDSNGGHHPATVPSAPGTPTVTPGDSQLTVTWAAVAGATSYEVYFNTTDNLSTATLAPDANNTDTTCTITGLTNGTTYYVWVKAKNSAGTSEASPVASGVPASSGPWSGTVSAGTTGDDHAMCIAVGAGGNVYIGGSTYGSFLTYTNPGGQDAFITEMDSSGSIMKNYQSQLSGTDTIRAMVADSAGNIIVTGQGPSKPFVAKFKPDLTPLWSADFGTNSSNVGALAVTVDGSDNIYVAGWTSNGFNGQTPTGDRDAFVIKFTSDGLTTPWTTFVGTSGEDMAYGVATDTSGNVYITGLTRGTFDGNTSAGGYDAFVAKLTNAGVLAAVTQFGTNDTDEAFAIAVDSNSGAVWVTGTTAGNLAPSSNVGTSDYFLAKFNSGTLALELSKQSSNELPSPYADTGLAIALDAVHNVYIAGYTFGSLNGQSFVGTPGSTSNTFLVKYGANGTLLWTSQLGSTGGADFTAVTVSGTNIFVAGRNFGGTFDGKAAVGGIDAVVVKYDSLGVKQ